jgi:trehalose 6-phosphate synthase
VEVNQQGNSISRRSVIIASNRGPITFSKDQNGGLTFRRGTGGLVTALSGLIGEIDATWISCAISEEDKEFLKGQIPFTENQDSINIKFITPDEDTYEGYYNVIANPLLWFLQHSMWNLPHSPVINRDTWEAWEDGYVAVNKEFSDTIVEQLASTSKPAIVMLQDYHQYLVANYIRQAMPPKERPTILHFIHIPWPGPEYWGILPPAMRQAILEGLCAVDILGFQTHIDALNFLRTCQSYLPRASIKYKPQRVWYRNHATHVRSFPISIDAQALINFIDSEEVGAYEAEIADMVSGCQLVLRIDRIEPSKNIKRGFQAFEEMLVLYPEHREKVSFLALLVPSRMDVEEYQSYLDELMAAAGHVNATYGTHEWEPIRVIVGDNYPRAIAALEFYDVLLVNSIADGMNLVAKEGPIVNQRNGVLILSERTGAEEQLKSGAIVISPCDVYATAEAIHQGLIMDFEQRQELATRLRWLINREDIRDWFKKQLKAVEELNL